MTVYGASQDTFINIQLATALYRKYSRRSVLPIDGVLIQAKIQRPITITYYSVFGFTQHHIVCQIIVAFRGKAGGTCPCRKGTAVKVVMIIHRHDHSAFRGLLCDLHPRRKLLKRLLRYQGLFFLRQSLYLLLNGQGFLRIVIHFLHPLLIGFFVGVLFFLPIVYIRLLFHIFPCIRQRGNPVKQLLYDSIHDVSHRHRDPGQAHALRQDAALRQDRRKGVDASRVLVVGRIGLPCDALYDDAVFLHRVGICAVCGLICRICAACRLTCRICAACGLTCRICAACRLTCRICAACGLTCRICAACRLTCRICAVCRRCRQRLHRLGIPRVLRCIHRHHKESSLYMETGCFPVVRAV